MRSLPDSRFLLLIGILFTTALVQAQTAPASPPPGGRGRGGGGGRSAYPQRAAADPAVVERGKGLFTVNCSFCHGSDARGGEDGPNLLRSTIVLNDKNGEAIAPIVRGGRGTGMPPISLTDAQISDVATFLHSFPVGGRDVARSAPPTIVVGNAAAGKAYFTEKCASCHTGTSDLKGIASRLSDPKTLQQTWLMPGGGRGASTSNLKPVTVTLTLADGKKAEGRLERIDDFLVTLRDNDGQLRSFPRKGEVPRVEIHDPLQPHLDLLPQYSDKNIHDVTAYLVTLK